MRKKRQEWSLDFSVIKKLKFVFLAAGLLILFFAARRVFLYTVFTLGTAVIIYYTKFYHFPIDISPLFFLEIVITRYYGLQWTLLFIFLAYIVPKTLAGQSMNWVSYVFIAIGLISNVLSLLFPTMPLVYVGYLSSIIQYIGGVMFQSTIKPVLLAASDGIANVANNMIWFLIFSDAIVWLMG